ncbi:MAG: hypothetical protein KDC12_06940 [Flavobacteriales bacterium]|nr:hypothetical protein [Flavobacteriales bacterium]
MEELMAHREEGRLTMRIAFHEPYFRLELIAPRNAVVALGKACESYRECVDLVVGEEYID